MHSDIYSVMNIQNNKNMRAILERISPSMSVMHPEKTCVMQVNVVYAEVLPFVFLFSSAGCFARQSIPEKK